MGVNPESKDEISREIETQLGPPGAGLPEIPEPERWNSEYGIDEAVAIAVTPERILIFWELARIIRGGILEDCRFRLSRLKLHGEVPTRQKEWPVRPAGRFQDSELEPDTDYLYVIARVSDDEETPLLVTNPVRTPPRRTLRDVDVKMPSSYDWMSQVFRKDAGGGS